MQLLMLSHDVVGSRMAGPGIRAWELARALASYVPTTLVAPNQIDLTPPPGLQLGSYTLGEPASFAPWLAGATVVLLNGHLLEAHPELAELDVPLIIDLYDPTMLENLELFRTASAAERSLRHQRDVVLFQRQLAAGDCFLCATERQRDLYIGALLLAGRVTPTLTDHDPDLRRLIDVVPFGLPAAAPVRQGPGLRGVVPGIGLDDLLLLWSGGLWDWMDPQTLVAAMPAVAEALPQVRLVFLAGRHPGHALPMQAGAQARTLAARLGLLDRHVFFYDEWVPYAQRADLLLEADLFVSLHRDHLETRYAAVRSRVLDHFWVGRPSLLSDGDPAAELIRAEGVGLVVPPEDPAAVSAALVQLLEDAELRAQQASRAHALASRLQWAHLIEPILRFVREPRHTRVLVPLLREPVRPTVASPVGRRNEAVRLLEERWHQLQQPAPGTPFLAHLGRRLAHLLVRPVMPLLAAHIQVVYAQAEVTDHLARVGKTQIEAFAMQLQGLEDAVLRLEALQRGEVPPPPISKE
ncbi:glycosyltransferase [Candidatus Chloroploca sp. M-50]|uniref:Glycosyltransferase n=2 Tax=Candidatus Chloroploca mongolica TaxID=2528176 RepID=A0ABS4D5I4_9CHLR|nr:glycosyltransferase [Candidatus Chloroploca mongolica]